MEEARIKANKIKNIEYTIDMIRMIDFKPWSKRFTEKDARSIIENAKNGEFDLAHNNIMKKIVNYYKCDGIDYAFDIAAMRGHFNVVKYIVDNSEDKNPSDAIGDTPLHRAAMGGHLAIVRYIMDKLEDKSPKDQEGNTPLHYAAAPVRPPLQSVPVSRQLEVFKYIFEHVDEKNPANLNGITPLHLAATQPEIDIVKYIVDNIEDRYTNDLPFCIPHLLGDKDERGWTSLHFAADSGRLKVFQYIMENVVDIPFELRNVHSSLVLKKSFDDFLSSKGFAAHPNR